MVVYVVQKGDTLSKIGLRYNVTVNAIKKANSDLIKNVNDIQVGWRLKIPIEESKNYYTIGKALEACLNDIEKLDSFKALKALL